MRIKLNKIIIISIFLLILILLSKSFSQNISENTGSITIDAVQNDVTVFINQKLYGVARGSSVIEDLTPGTYSIKVKKEGYNDWYKKVTVNANQNVELKINLQAVSVPENKSYKSYNHKEENKISTLRYISLIFGVTSTGLSTYFHFKANKLFDEADNDHEKYNDAHTKVEAIKYRKSVEDKIDKGNRYRVYEYVGYSVAGISLLYFITGFKLSSNQSSYKSHSRNNNNSQFLLAMKPNSSFIFSYIRLF